MKLLALLAIAISLLSAGPADAAHHQRAHRETATHRALGGAGSNPAGSTTMQHSAVPMPRERPSNMARPDGGMRHAAALDDGRLVEPVERLRLATGTNTTETRLIELGQQLVLVGMWRLQTDQFYRR